MLLAKTLRSSTLRLALICIGIFGAAVFALFSYVYWSTASYVRSRSDQAIAAEHALLSRAYDGAGRSGLVAAIEQRMGEELFAGGQYLLVDPSSARVAGNLKAWPAALTGASGWGNFSVPEGSADAPGRPVLRATFETLSDGSRLLVGKDLEGLDDFATKINTALVWGISLIFVLAGVASIAVTQSPNPLKMRSFACKSRSPLSHLSNSSVTSI